MTFQGDKIVGKPTLAIVEIYIAEKGLFCDAKECFDYWEERNWLTKKGEEVKTLEAAINVFNSKAIQKYRKEVLDVNRHNVSSKDAKHKEKEIAELNKKKKPYSLYKEQIKDQRWKIFRWFILKIRGEKCEVCGSVLNLQVHHIEYKDGLKAWEYSCKDVMVVCRDCHKKIHNIK